MNNINDLIEYISELHRNNAIHIKRGFRLQDATPLIASNHLIEETVELQAEVICGNEDGIIDEASDALACLLHLLEMKKITLDVIAKHSKQKLIKVFSTDIGKITAITNGFSRRGRAGQLDS